MRKIHQNVPLRFEPREWTVEETEFSELTNKTNETIFSLGNGYLGVRGVFEEGYYGFVGNTVPGTVINGIYEYHDYHHIWCRPGYPGRYHSIINQPEAFQVHIYVNGKRVLMDPQRTTDFRRVLDLRRGLLIREYTYHAEDGLELRLSFERFVSLAEKHTAAMRVTVAASRGCELVLESRLDGEVKSTGLNGEQWGYYPDDSFVLGRPAYADNIASVTNSIKRSGFVVCAAAADNMHQAEMQTGMDGRSCFCKTYRISAKPGAAYTMDRVVCYCTDRDSDQPEVFARRMAKQQLATGYDSLKKEHCKQWECFWEDTGVDVQGDVALLQGLRFSMFHLNQGAGRDGITNISANCLTGTSYSGWTFWDTEIFMSPMFLYSQPETARQLLVYRYHILDKARERASQMDDRGALYAWSSINGEECAHIFEAATAQYHINMDVYYAIDRYVQVTGDVQFLVEYGAEILFEMSKCLAHRGCFVEMKDNQFCINVVCGPDEYSPIVDNNCYTNWLCRKMFYYTLDTASMLREEYPERYKQLMEKCVIDEQELVLWKRAADNMYIPYHKGLQLYMQDDQILYRDPIDIENIPIERLPLLNNLHPLNLWRYQVIKQADIVLLMYLCGEDFTQEMKKKVFDFYEPKTIHDSSLSAGIHSIVACDIGYADEAYGYFRQSARMDLDNINRNTDIGVHSACMGNSWQILTGGFAGLRLYHGEHHFTPFLPEQWEGYSFRLQLQKGQLEVKISRGEVQYTMLRGVCVEFYHHEEKVILSGERLRAVYAL